MDASGYDPIERATPLAGRAIFKHGFRENIMIQVRFARWQTDTTLFLMADVFSFSMNRICRLGMESPRFLRAEPEGPAKFLSVPAELPCPAALFHSNLKVEKCGKYTRRHVTAQSDVDHKDRT